MAVVAKRSKPPGNIMADATDRLLLATKKKMLRDQGRVDYDKLSRQGFSAAMIARLKEL